MRRLQETRRIGTDSQGFRVALDRFVKGWRKQPRSPLSSELEEALVELSVRSNYVTDGLMEVPHDAQVALGEVAMAADTLSDSTLMALMGTLSSFASRVPSELEFEQIPLAVLRLCTMDAKYLTVSLAVLLPLTNYYKSINMSLLELARNNGINVIQVIVQSFSTKNINSRALFSLLDLIQSFSSDRAIGNLDDLRAVLNYHSKIMEEYLDDPALVKKCQDSIYGLCTEDYLIGISGLEELLLELHLPQKIHWFQLLDDLRALRMVRVLFRIGSTLQREILESNILDAIEKSLQEGSEFVVEGFALIVTIIECCDERNLDRMVSSSRFRDQMIFPQGFRFMVARKLLTRYSALPRDIGATRPLFQLYLAEYLMERAAFNLLEHMRGTSMATNIKELRELPIRYLVNVFTNPLYAHATEEILREPSLLETALDVAWLSFIIGAPLKRHSNGALTDPLQGRYRDDRSKNRIRGMYSIIWALGLATGPRRRCFTEDRVWLMSDLWQLIWRMLYQ